MCNFLIIILLGWITLPHFSESASIPHDEAWCYDPDNCVADEAEAWEGECNVGVSQSPINIETKKANESSAELKLIFSQEYDQNHKDALLVNNGHTAEVIMKEEGKSNMKLEGGLGSYVFSQLHFHWGKNDSNGSEHMMDGKLFQMEMHVVHVNTKFKSPTEALNLTKSNPDRKRAMLVIAVFVNDDGPDNPAFSPIIDRLSSLDLTSLPIAVKNVTKTLDKEINVMKMLPTSDDMSLFEYEGSLTTPLCHEIVHWAVLKKPIHISKAQMAAFRSLKTFDSKRIAGNFRPIQPLNKRKLIYHSNVKVITGGIGSKGKGNALKASTFTSFTIGFILINICTSFRGIYK